MYEFPCLSPWMEKVISDPRNEKVLHKLLSTPHLPKVKLLVDESGLITVVPLD